MNELSTGCTLQQGKYKILKKLGQGGFGITYEGVQTRLNRRVAIKEFFMEDYCEREDESSQVTIVGTKGNRELVKRFSEKFVKEAQLIAGLEDVPHIIRIHDVFEENGTAYYVMQFIEGGSLKDLVKRKGKLDEATAICYISQVADALSALHQRHIMHLDVKPDNILLKDDEAVLIDFGVSKHYDKEGNATTTTPVARSKGYAPLEQYKQGGVGEFSPETDIYSLGATLYYLLTGENPPEATELASTPIAYPTFVSGNIRKAISLAMNPSKEERPQTVNEFLPLLTNSDSNKADETLFDSDSDIVEKDDGEIILLFPARDKRGRWGFVDKLGHVVIAYEWSQVEDFSYVGIDDLAPVADEFGRWGFINRSGKIIIKCKYKSADFNGSWCRVQNAEGKWGIIDRYERVIIPCVWNSIGFFLDEYDLVCVEDENGKYGYVAINGDLSIPCQYNIYSFFKEGLCATKNFENKYGFIDKSGEVIIPFTWDDAREFKGGWAPVKDSKGKWGFIDKNGEVIIPCIWDEIWPVREDGASVKKNGKWGWIDKKGNIVIPCQWEDFFSFREGLAAVRNESGKYGYINESGTVVVPFVWSDASDFVGGLASVQNADGKDGFIDKTGKLIILCHWEHISGNFEDGLVRVKNETLEGYIDKSGKWIVKWPVNPSKLYLVYDYVFWGCVLYSLIAPWFSENGIIKYTIPSFALFFLLYLVIAYATYNIHVNIPPMAGKILDWGLQFIFLFSSIITTLSFLSII